VYVPLKADPLGVSLLVPLILPALVLAAPPFFSVFDPDYNSTVLLLPVILL